MVVVDRLTKYAHFIPLSHPFSATTVARFFIDQVHKLHGVPESIVSDRDKVLTSDFWRELCYVRSWTQKFATASHRKDKQNVLISV